MIYKGLLFYTVTETFDIQLIDSCRKGNRVAQKVLYDRLAPRMFPVCIRYVGDRTVAEDVLQDGFITLFTRLDSYKGDGSFEGWARRIFVTTALMCLRKKDALKMSEGLESARSLKTETVGQIEKIGYKELLERLILFNNHKANLPNAKPKIPPKQNCINKSRSTSPTCKSLPLAMT